MFVCDISLINNFHNSQRCNLENISVTVTNQITNWYHLSLRLVSFFLQFCHHLSNLIISKLLIYFFNNQPIAKKQRTIISLLPPRPVCLLWKLSQLISVTIKFLFRPMRGAEAISFTNQIRERFPIRTLNDINSICS